jgi:hypothetical protein
MTASQSSMAPRATKYADEHPARFTSNCDSVHAFGQSGRPDRLRIGVELAAVTFTMFAPTNFGEVDPQRGRGLAGDWVGLWDRRYSRRALASFFRGLACVGALNPSAFRVLTDRARKEACDRSTHGHTANV